MLEKLEYLSFWQYSPRGQSNHAKMSYKLVGSLKAGRIEQSITRRITEIVNEHKVEIEPYLNPEAILVPIPRSSLTKTSDLWPALEICRVLETLGLGKGTVVLKRTVPLRKSSLSVGNRPTVKEQVKTMTADLLILDNPITLVDDILTLGRTSIAAGSILKDVYPNLRVRLFTPVRTVGLQPDIDKVRNVVFGTINYNDKTGYIEREP